MDLISLLPIKHFDVNTLIASAGAGVVLYQAWKFISSVLNPMQYAEKLYDIADRIVESADNNILDKIRNKYLKDKIQEDLKKTLEKRKEKIDKLISKIGD